MTMSAAQRGFTLVEAVIVIVITGILGGMAAMFITRPVQGYIDTVRRAELTDVADTALRRMARDIQSALPNSVRPTAAAGSFLEFFPIKAAGRYRAVVDVGGAGDPLSFATPPDDTTFDVLKPDPAAGTGVAVAAGDSIVIYNQGLPDYDVYNAPGLTSSRRAAVAPFGTVTNVAFTAIAGTPFRLDSPGRRFQVVGSPVTYACDLPNGTLWRYSGYAIQVAQPVTIATLDGLGPAVAGIPVTKAALATNVDCATTSMSYANGVLQHQGLVTILLVITRDGETVRLQHQVNVDNTP